MKKTPHKWKTKAAKRAAKQVAWKERQETSKHVNKKKKRRRLWINYFLKGPARTLLGLLTIGIFN